MHPLFQFPCCTHPPVCLPFLCSGWGAGDGGWGASHSTAAEGGQVDLPETPGLGHVHVM